MKVDDVLKDSEAARQKEGLLDDKNLDSEIVDKLASDPSVAVRRKAVRHDKITDVGLWKIITQKKNYEEDYMLSNAFRKISMELKIKWFREKKFLDYEKKWIFDKIKWPLLADIDTSSFKDEFSSMMIQYVLSNEFNYDFVRWWLAKHYSVKDDKKLYAFFEEKYPDELIRYREEIGVSEDEVDKLFDKYTQETEYRMFDPLQDFGYEFLEKMKGDQITTLFKKMNYVPKDVLMYLVDNKNLTVEHTYLLFSKPDYFENNGAYGRDNGLLYALERLPLDKKCDALIFKEIQTQFTNKKHPYKIFENWAKNKTHNKQDMIKRLAAWDAENGGWSGEVIDGLLSTGMYSDEDVEKIMANKDDYYALSTYITTVKNANFPTNKLRELWKKYWHGEWKEAEIDGPSYSGSFGGWSLDYIKPRLHELVYNMIKFSPLAGEFGMEYYNIHKDEKYLPEVAKDIFMF